jgi:alpha-beta hydrolase superfamily lysophospholipase
MDDVERGQLGEYASTDGRTLRYRVIRAAHERHVLVYLHGIESHGEWFLATARALAERGCTTYLVDRRGSGLNRNTDEGDAPSANVLLDDVRRFREHAALESLFLVGLSWGGKLALAAALDEPRGVRGLVLVTPALVPKVDFSWPQKLGVAISVLSGGRARFHVPIEPEMFTKTPRYLEYIRNDPLRLQRVSARFLLATRRLDRWIRARVHTLECPALLFLAGHDRIIDNTGTRALLASLREGQLRVKEYAHATHSIQFDDTAELARDIGSFVEEVPC